MTDKQNIIIMGAAGRDLHNFNVYFTENTAYDDVGCTATQIPNIKGRLDPSSITGDLYPNGISIFPEDDLVPLLDEHSIDQVIAADVDLVIIGTPIDLGRKLNVDKPTVRVRYELESTGDPTLKDVIANKFKNK